MQDKDALRRYFSALRSGFAENAPHGALKDAFLASPYFSAESFFVYISVRSEAATDRLIAALIAAGKRVCVPRIEGGRMLSVPFAPLEKGAFGIPAPRGGEDAACDVCVTPLLAVDERGVRLGYGGGYYDAYFARRPQTVRVGYCFEAQRTRLLPKEAWDKPLHAVVTEAGVHRFNA